MTTHGDQKTAKVGQNKEPYFEDTNLHCKKQ